MGEERPVRGARRERAVGRTGFATRCIAIWPELWFDGLGFPSGPAACPPRSRLWGGAALGQASRPQVPEHGSRNMRRGGRMTVSSDGASSGGGFIEGAMTKMLVFKRLAAMAVVIGA